MSDIGKIRLSEEELKGSPTADFNFTLIGWEKAPSKEDIIRFHTTISQIAEEWGFRLVDPMSEDDKPSIIVPH